MNCRRSFGSGASLGHERRDSCSRYDARSATPSLPTYLSRWHGQQRQKLPTYLPGEVFVTVRHVIKTDERHFRSVDSNHVVASAASCQ